MGCDGGTIPRRDEMVKLKKKAEKVGPSVTNFVLLAIHRLYNFIAQNLGSLFICTPPHTTHITILAG